MNDDTLRDLSECLRSARENVEALRRELRGDYGKVRDLKPGDVVRLEGGEGALLTVGRVDRCVLHAPSCRAVFDGDWCRVRHLDVDHPIRWVSKAPAVSPYANRAEADEARGLAEDGAA